MGIFLPYLPHDTQEEAFSDAVDVAELINTDLAELLQKDASSFWTVVKSERSLKVCLDSYLQFSRRPHDVQASAMPASQAQDQLYKRVFLCLLRLVSNEKDAPPAADRAALIYNEWWLDVPKLMDIAVLYGQDNQATCQSFMLKVFTLQPRYAGDLADVAPTLVSNLDEVAQALFGAVAQLRSGQDDALASSLTDGLAYLHDAAVTLAVFVEAYPPAAGVMMAVSGGSLLGLLPPLHDELAGPLLAASAEYGTSKDAASQVHMLARGLRAALRRLAHQLLLHAYLNPQALPAGCDPRIAGLLPTSPSARGEAVASAVIALGQLPGSAVGGKALEKGCLVATDCAYHLMDAIRAAERQGKIALDETQREYIAVLAGGAKAAPAAACEASTSGAGGSVSTGDAEHECLRAAIAQIHQVLPEYGAGFLAACLHAAGGQAEAVIDQLLEGALPAEVAGLDPHMPLMADGAAGGLAAGAKGKAAARPATANGHGSSAPAAELSWLSLAERASAVDQRAIAASSSSGRTEPAPAHRGVHRATARVLGDVGADRTAIKAHAAAAQWEWEEYEDEPDDSFDDLGGAGADGVADIEGDDEDRPSRGTATGTRPAGLPARPARAWVLDGKIYNYKKEGAKEVSGSHATPQAVAAAAKAAAEQIHGLGAGGNVPAARRPSQPGPGELVAPGEGRELHQEAPGLECNHADGASGRGSRGRGRGPATGRAPGRGRGNFAAKEKHKAAVANHHRKDRAMRKFAGPSA